MVVEPVAVSSSLKKRADLIVGSRGQTAEYRQGQAFIGLSDGACRMKAEDTESGCA